MPTTRSRVLNDWAVSSATFVGRGSLAGRVPCRSGPAAIHQDPSEPCHRRRSQPEHLPKGPAEMSGIGEPRAVSGRRETFSVGQHMQRRLQAYPPTKPTQRDSDLPNNQVAGASRRQSQHFRGIGQRPGRAGISSHGLKQSFDALVERTPLRDGTAEKMQHLSMQLQYALRSEPARNGIGHFATNRVEAVGIEHGQAEAD